MINNGPELRFYLAACLSVLRNTDLPGPVGISLGKCLSFESRISENTRTFRPLLSLQSCVELRQCNLTLFNWTKRKNEFTRKKPECWFDALFVQYISCGGLSLQTIFECTWIESKQKKMLRQNNRKIWHKNSHNTAETLERGCGQMLSLLFFCWLFNTAWTRSGYCSTYPSMLEGKDGSDCGRFFVVQKPDCSESSGSFYALSKAAIGSYKTCRSALSACHASGQKITLKLSWCVRHLAFLPKLHHSPQLNKKTLLLIAFGTKPAPYLCCAENQIRKEKLWEIYHDVGMCRISLTGFYRTDVQFVSVEESHTWHQMYCFFESRTNPTAALWPSRLIANTMNPNTFKMWEHMGVGIQQSTCIFGLLEFS